MSLHMTFSSLDIQITWWNHDELVSDCLAEEEVTIATIFYCVPFLTVYLWSAAV